MTQNPNYNNGHVSKIIDGMSVFTEESDYISLADAYHFWKFIFYWGIGFSEFGYLLNVKVILSLKIKQKGLVCHGIYFFIYIR